MTEHSNNPSSNSIDLSNPTPRKSLSFLFVAIITTGMAAGLDWGVRWPLDRVPVIKFPGVLAALSLVMFFAPRASALTAARAAAMMVIALSFGCFINHGSTLRLFASEKITEVNLNAWGFIGLFLKGALWIGFGGAFLGMGLSGKRYKISEVFFITLGLLILWHLGVLLLNKPFNPYSKEFPTLYFSVKVIPKWYGNTKPVPEYWGGFLVALIGLMIYLKRFRKDSLAVRLTFTGILLGGTGLCLAYLASISRGWIPTDMSVDWANEVRNFLIKLNYKEFRNTCFAFIWGAGFALSLWKNQRLIKAEEIDDSTKVPWFVDFIVLMVLLPIVCSSFFIDFPQGTRLMIYCSLYAIVMIAVPLMMVVGGRINTYFILFLISSIQLCGTSLLFSFYNADATQRLYSWLFFVILPLNVILCLGGYLIYKSFKNQSGNSFAAISLIVLAPLYAILHTYRFRSSWPGAEGWKFSPHLKYIFYVFVLVIMIVAFLKWFLEFESKDDQRE